MPLHDESAINRQGPTETWPLLPLGNAFRRIFPAQWSSGWPTQINKGGMFNRYRLWNPQWWFTCNESTEYCFARRFTMFSRQRLQKLVFPILDATWWAPYHIQYVKNRSTQNITANARGKAFKVINRSKTLSNERDPFTAKNQTLRSYQSTYFANYDGHQSAIQIKSSKTFKFR